MAKPILIARFPYDTISHERAAEVAKELKAYNTDYVNLIFRDNTVSRLEFEVLNADKAEQQDIDQIQKRVNEILCQTNPTSTTKS